MWQRWVRRIVFAVSLACATFLGYTLVTRTAPASPPRVEVSRAVPGTDGGLEEVAFFQSRHGVVQWEVRAERARILEADHRAVLDMVEVILYRDEEREFRLEGEQGTIDTESRNFVVINHDRPLTVELAEGYTMYTKRLAWTDARREVHTDDEVTIVGPGVELTGRGLIGRLDANEFQVQHDVRAQIAP